jgi:hypothetical protein
MSASETAVESRQLLSPEQFAAESSFSLPTVRRYLASGKLLKVQPAGKRGRIGIPRSELSKLSVTAASPGDLSAGNSKPPNDHKSAKRRFGPAPRWLGGNT